MNHTTIILFGITGDLAQKKLIPALYKLIENKKLSSFLLIGAAREKITAFEILEKSRQYIEKIDENCFKTLYDATHYQQLDIYNEHDFKVFADFIQQKESTLAITHSDRIAYCATASDLFIPITTSLFKTKIIRSMYDKTQSNDKIVYEKPFGKSKNNAHAINECIKTYFDEKQIFRIDHYLSKELVRSLLNIRFSNSIFEPLLNNQYIEQIQIIAREKIGIENRGLYYDQYGAVQDMVQNHLLSLLALLTLEQPEHYTPTSISLARSDILQNVIFKNGILGQYEGYKNELHIAQSSTTETYAALVFSIENDRWRTIPFFIETGKCLEKKETIIRIKFKPQSEKQPANWLTLKIAPEALFSLSLHIKSPRSRDEIITVPMEFCHSCVFGSETAQAYEILLQEVLDGDHSIAIDPQEIEYAWNIAESIAQKNLPLYEYKKGTNGPTELKEFCIKEGIDLQ